MRVDELMVRVARAGLILTVVLVVLADPANLVDGPISQVLREDLGPLVRVVAVVGGLATVAAAATVARGLDVAGESRRPVVVLLAVAGASLAVFGVTTPGETGADVVTTSSAANTLALLAGSMALPAAMIVQAARWRRDPMTAASARAAFAVAVVSLWSAFAFSLAQEGQIPWQGLWQRISFVAAWSWLAVQMLRQTGWFRSGSEGTRT